MNAHDVGMTQQPPAENEADTGLPRLRTWRSVYVFVLVAFCVWVGSLLLLQSLFS